MPQPWQILGTAMQPFSLGHHLLFKRLNLPFAGNHDADAGIEDILLAIAVCAHTHDEVLAAFLDGSWPTVYRNWRQAVRGPWWRRRNMSPIAMAKVEIRFRAYIKDGYSRPPVWKRSNSAGGLDMTAPWECLLKVRLVEAGFTETEVLNGYLPARWYDYYTAIEIRNAAKCESVNNWKKIFYTREHHEELHPGEETTDA